MTVPPSDPGYPNSGSDPRSNDRSRSQPPPYPTSAQPPAPSYPANTPPPAGMVPYHGPSAPAQAYPAHVPQAPQGQYGAPSGSNGWAPGYGWAYPPPYYSDKTKTAAGLLQLLPGFFLAIGGIGRCYSGHVALGVVHIVLSVLGWLLTPVVIGLPIVFACWLWALIDGIVLLSGRPTDPYGRLLR